MAAQGSRVDFISFHPTIDYFWTVTENVYKAIIQLKFLYAIVRHIESRKQRNSFNRQPTPFDRICYRVVDKDQGPLGSRVFGDCDRLMKQVYHAAN